MEENFVSEVLCLVAQVKTMLVPAVHKVDQNMEQLLLPLKHNFVALGDLLNSMEQLAC